MKFLLSKMLPAATALLASLIAFSPVWGAGYTEIFHSGRIDWSKGFAEAVGTTVVPPKKLKSEKAKTAAANEAVQTSRANLFDLIGRIKVDSVTTVKDLVQQSEPLGQKIRDLVAKVQPKKVRFSNNGRVEATVGMSMTGALSELVLPQSISAIDSIQAMNPNQNSEKESFTGVVVECSGIRVRPAMFPTIVDEDGQLVYGSPHIHREHAVKKGVALYTRDAGEAKKDERVAPRPLVLKGIRAAKSGPSDIVISNTDAGKVKGNAHHLKLLQSCKVIIVLE